MRPKPPLHPRSPPRGDQVIRRFPADFAEVLTPHGLRILEGRSPLEGALSREGRRFLTLPRIIDPKAAQGCLQILERAFPGKLTRMETPIPPEALWGMTHNYAELLPKSARVWTAQLASRRERAFGIAEEVGLVRFLRSESFRLFAQRLNGRPLRKRWGIQLLCYGPGDYAGPHNDHHPEDAEAQDGYLDVHLTFANAGVGRQLLVYERRGHLSEVTSVRTVGGMTAYRLPFWHYTTPLEPRRGRGEDARRWVLLGTFLDARPPRSTAP